MYNVLWECLYVERCINIPQRQEPSSCCTSSSLVWQRWQRLRLRCLEPLRDVDDDDAHKDDDDDDDEDLSPSGTSPTLALFSGETSLSDSEAGDTQKTHKVLTLIAVLNVINLHFFYKR